MRLGSQVKPDGALFRIFGSYAPVTPAGTLEIESPGENLAGSNPTRVFPDMAQIADGNTNAATGTCPDMPPSPATVPVPVIECFAEWLPTADYVGSALAPNTEPSLNFRFTARDLDPAAGGYSYGDVKLTLDKTAGPFLVNSKNGAGAAAVGGRTETVTWAVANTAALAPDVRISLSTDRGATFPYVLQESTPNDGSAAVVWPNVETSTARLKIEAVDNYFFDINNSDLSIGSSLTVDGPTATTTTAPYGLGVSPAVEFGAVSGAVDGDQIATTVQGLPAGLTIERWQASADGVRPGTAEFRVAGRTTAAAGTYPVTVTVADGVNDPVPVSFTVVVTGGPGDTAAPQTSLTSGPEDGSVLRKRKATFGFTSSEGGSTFRCLLDGAPLACGGGSVTLADLAPGTHELAVQAVDAAGNVDATPGTTTFTVPLDDGVLARKGDWRRVRDASAFGGDYQASDDKGARLSYRIEDAVGVTLVVSTGPRFGPVKVFLGNTLLKKIPLQGGAGTTRLKNVATFDAPRSGRLRIVVAKNKQVRIEGLAVVTEP